uniref:ATP synthase F0 subunit 6 n=1 Tax=Hammerschmidtiella sp. ZengetLiu-2016 TaxID=2025463 RepID=A0A3Q8B604_9BILA|nr:ATP synthase F0 subunit 6 [Hammerschmidtiella sp. ZengetLiu-2016]
MSFLYFFHVFVYIYVAQFFLLPYISYVCYVWRVFLNLVVQVFGFDVISPMGYVFSSLYFLLMIFGCYYGHLSWNISWGRVAEFTFVWALVGWLVTFFVLMSEEILSNVFGLFGERYVGVLYAIWSKMSTVFVRPFSLSLRLTINLTVGHFVMSSWIISQEMVGENFSWSGLIFTQFVLVMLVAIESIVYVLQSFIFSRLLSIYLEEV